MADGVMDGRRWAYCGRFRPLAVMAADRRAVALLSDEYYDAGKREDAIDALHFCTLRIF
jgi:hypothetical protein